MYFGLLLILVAFSTQQVTFSAVTTSQPPIESVSDDLLETKDEVEVESLTSPDQSADGNASFDSESTSFGSATDESVDHLFQFVHDADIKTDEDFAQIIQQLETTTEQQYAEALEELEQWFTIPMLSKYQEETAEGLKIAKDQLSQATASAGANISNQLQSVKNTEGPENLQKSIKQIKKVFEIEVMPKLQYFIDAVTAIKAIGQERMKNQHGPSTRSLQLTRSTPQMGATTTENTYNSTSAGGQETINETAGCGTEFSSRMRRGEPTGTGTTGMNTGAQSGPYPTKIGTPMQTSGRQTGREGISGSARSTSSSGSGIINEGLDFGNEITRTGLSGGSEMMRKTLAYGEGMTESASKFGENMASNVKSGSSRMKGMSDDIFGAGERMSNYVSGSGRRGRNTSWESSSMEEDSFEHHRPRHGPPHKHRGPPRKRGSHEKHCKESEEEYRNRGTYKSSEDEAGISEFENGMSTRTYSSLNGNGKMSSTSGIRNY